LFGFLGDDLLRFLRQRRLFYKGKKRIVCWSVN
jgi:hypothetical protein